MPHRNFNEERAGLEPVTFEIGTAPDGSPAQFTCRREVAPESILKYEGIDENTPGREAFPIFDEVVKSIIVPADADLWDFVRRGDSADTLGLGSLNALVAWLVEAVVARPTVTPSASPHGSESPATGTPSTVASPSPVGVASAG